MQPEKSPTLFVVLFATLAAVLAACGQQDAAPDEPAAEVVASETVADAPARYAIRGQVIEEPPEDRSGLRIRHEAIDDFRDRDGKVSGMDSMAMFFPLAPEADVAGVEAGDKIRFVMEVDWNADPLYRIVEVTELPAETELHYSFAEPAEE